MRVAVNTRFLLAGKLEGIGRFTHEILSRMVKNHPEVEFLFIFDRAYDPAFIYEPNVKPVVISPPARHPFLYIAWFEWAVARILKKYKPDIFLSTDGYCTLTTDIPTTLVMHDIAFEHIPDAMNRIGMWYHKKYMPLFARKATRIAAVSEFTKSDLHRTYGIPTSKIDVVYNAPARQFMPLSQEQVQQLRATKTNGKGYFIYVGAMHPRKNIANLLRAYNRYLTLTQDPLPLIIVGRKAWDTDEIERAYSSISRKDMIQFTGRVSDDELAGWIGAAHCLVYVPYFEGFGLPIVEAMACGVPVITSDCTSMPEVGGKAALLVNPADYISIAAALHSMTENDELYNAHKQLTLQQAATFNWDKSAHALWECILKSIHHE
ncbi:MAG: glycosyltransferase family 4 protein [Bacteroidota bacterium]|jgi:glycosyltransferase involved in cell wall biosynthesis